MSEALGVAIEAGLSRLPVHDGNVDDIVGVAHAKDLIRAERAGHGGEPVRDVVRPAHFVPETKRVARLMREMQDLKYHLAVVVDEYGGTAGVVTLEDLIEELVGEIVDEYDVEEPPVQRSTTVASRSRPAWPWTSWANWSTPTCPGANGTPWGACSSTCSAGCPSKASRWRSTASPWWPSGWRATGWAGSGSCPWTRSATTPAREPDDGGRPQ